MLDSNELVLSDTKNSKLGSTAVYRLEVYDFDSSLQPVLIAGVDGPSPRRISSGRTVSTSRRGTSIRAERTKRSSPG